MSAPAKRGIGQRDWDDVYKRLRQAEDNVAAAFEPPPDTVRAVLRERALKLAPVPAEPVAETFVDLVLFTLGAQTFAIDATQSDQVVPLGTLTALPGVPAFYRGLVNYSGRVCPVLDVRPLLETPDQGPVLPAYAIIVAGDHATVALAAETVDTLPHFAESRIASASPGDGHRSVRGMTDTSAIVVDVAALLQDARVVVDERPVISDNDGAMT